MKYALLFGILLLSIAISAAAPAPPQLIINNATKQCSDFTAGDECTRCEAPEGWTVLAYGIASCPKGYEEIRADIACRPLRAEFCCSEGHSGAPGNCSSMVVDDATKRCAFDDGKCYVPDMWKRENAFCPAGYEWTENPCLPDAPMPSPCPALLIPPLLLLFCRGR